MDIPGTFPPIALVGDARTLPQLLIAGAAHFSDSAAITDGVTTYHYRDLPALASNTATFLSDLGIVAGDRVLVASENSIEMLQLFLACSWLQAIFVPINPMSSDEQVKHFVFIAEPKLIFTDEEVANKWVNYSNISKKLVIRNLASDVSQIAKTFDGKKHTAPNCSPGTTLAILFTSGTTSFPKGVICPNAQFIHWGEIVGGILEMHSADRVYTCLPLFHTNALNALVQCLIHGARFQLGPRFSVSRFWSTMVETESTITYLLGAMISMLMTAPESLLDRSHKLKNILAPGTPTPILPAFEARHGIRLVEAHGMTETNATIGPDGKAQRIGFMGKVLPGFEAQVIDDAGNQVPDGTPGELVMRTHLPFAFATGYWRQEDETKKSWRNEWFYSGDRVVCEAGWYKFVDRIKDVIRRRGENISAWEVEQALQSLPYVSVAAAIAVPSELGEDEVMAFIVPTNGVSTSPEVILDDCAKILPYFALPRFIEFVDNLPLTETGKIRKADLRQHGVQATSWDSQKAGYVVKR